MNPLLQVAFGSSMLCVPKVHLFICKFLRDILPTTVLQHRGYEFIQIVCSCCLITLPEDHHQLFWRCPQFQEFILLIFELWFDSPPLFTSFLDIHKVIMCWSPKSTYLRIRKAVIYYSLWTWRKGRNNLYFNSKPIQPKILSQKLYFFFLVKEHAMLKLG